jgi:hypothetical protein
MGAVTLLLDEARRGNANAQQQLFAHLYGELDRLARRTCPATHP